MYTHVCKTAKRIKKQAADYVKKIDWKKVAVATVATVAAVAVTVATAGAAAPVIAGMVGTAGLSGLGAAVVTGVAVGAVSGAAGGAVNAFTTSVLSGDKPVTILKNTFTGMVNGAVTGGATGGLLGVAGSATSSVANPVARHVVDTAGETVVDTIVDASQGGQVTPASIATSLAINALSEGIPTRGAKGAKADVPKNKPRAGDVQVNKTKPSTNVESSVDMRQRVLANIDASKKARDSSNFDEHLRREAKVKQDIRKQQVLEANRTKGRAFEIEKFDEFKQISSNAQEQITIVTNDGTKFRTDAIGHDSATGDLILQEYKSSATARLTKNQEDGFEQLFENGGHVVGKGKGDFAGGFLIPVGTRVQVIRP